MEKEYVESEASSDESEGDLLCKFSNLVDEGEGFRSKERKYEVYTLHVKCTLHSHVYV